MQDAGSVELLAAETGEAIQGITSAREDDAGARIGTPSETPQQQASTAEPEPAPAEAETSAPAESAAAECDPLPSTRHRAPSLSHRLSSLNAARGTRASRVGASRGNGRSQLQRSERRAVRQRDDGAALPAAGIPPARTQGLSTALRIAPARSGAQRSHRRDRSGRRRGPSGRSAIRCAETSPRSSGPRRPPLPDRRQSRPRLRGLSRDQRRRPGSTVLRSILRRQRLRHAIVNRSSHRPVRSRARTLTATALASLRSENSLRPSAAAVLRAQRGISRCAPATTDRLIDRLMRARHSQARPQVLRSMQYLPAQR